MIPSCFSQPSSDHHPHSLISSIYQINLCNSPLLLTLTWSKSLSSHSLSLHASHSFSITLSLYPPSFSFLRPSSKSISHNLKLHWDFSRAKFTPNSAHPDSGFYLAVSYDGRLVFFLGDRLADFARRSRLVMPDPVREEAALSRREHVFGRRKFVSRAEIVGAQREIGIELSSGGALRLTIDGEIKLTVKRLAWKFRGNERFFIGGAAVDFFWDVFNWVKNDGADCGGHGVFGFQVGEGAVWPEVGSIEMKFMRKCLPSAAADVGSAPTMAMPWVSQWAEESSDGGRSSCSSSSRSSGGNGGFSLLLYAWRRV